MKPLLEVFLAKPQGRNEFVTVAGPGAAAMDALDAQRIQASPIPAATTRVFRRIKHKLFMLTSMRCDNIPSASSRYRRSNASSSGSSWAANMR